MPDLRDLYQEVILDHNKRPRNFRVREDASHRAVGHNPLCGDQLTVYLEVDGGIVRDASFEGSGCAISKASASMMTDAVKGKTVPEVEQLFEAFHAMVTSDPGSEPDVEAMGKLAVFAGVCEYPARVKCASLAWHTLQAAIHDEAAKVSTE